MTAKDDHCMDTIERLKEIAADRSLSFYKLSQICDIPYSTLKNAEMRNGQLSIDSIERICEKLGIPVYSFFMTDEDWAGIEDQKRQRMKA